MKLQAKKLKSHKLTGFSLIEVLLVIGIIFLLAGAALPIYGNLQVSSQLNESTSQIIQTIRIAKARSVARVNNASHGVFFDTTNKKYALYQGTAWPGTVIYEVTLESALSFSTTLTGNDVNFSKGLGLPSSTGTITLTHQVSGSRSITVNSFGAVE